MLDLKITQIENFDKPNTCYVDFSSISKVCTGETVNSQQPVGDEMLQALTEMVNAARADKLENTASLAMAAIGW